MSTDSDFLYALQLQNEINEISDDSIEEVDFKIPQSKKPINSGKYRSNLDEDYLNRTQNLVHPEWETLDPTPDIHALFSAFDGKFFQGRLKCVTLEWSKRMYSCAGICYSRRNRLGMAVTVRLSEPLLKLRPRKDLVETLLHEMIHAYCFVLNIREGNGGHGPNFKKIMYSINKVAGTNITVYHTFHDEVELYKQHWWRCNGICQNRSPFFGYVKRTCNRAPGPNDQWWAAHQASCSGTFMKIKGPDNSNKENKKKGKNLGGDLRQIFAGINSKTTKKENGAVKGNTSTPNVLTKKTTNPKSTVTNATPIMSSLVSAFPPTSYPGPSWDPLNANKSAFENRNNTVQDKRNTLSGGNLANVKGFRDLNAETPTTNTNSSKSFGSTGGFSLGSSSNNSVISPGSQVDRDHLRTIWSKRFETSKNSQTNSTEMKKRRINNEEDLNDAESIYINDEEPTDKRKRLENEWEVIDDEVMIQEIKNEIINLSSDDESADDDDVEEIVNVPKVPKKLTQEERQTAIKQEIIDDDGVTDDDIILIDDEYDDEQANISAAVELADTSLIDEFFGEDTMLEEFHNENDVVASGSNRMSSPGDEIITCPICQSKMQRKVLANHLDGCTGIAIPLKLDIKSFKKISPQLPRKKYKKSTSSKDLLRKAGYTEKDLLDISLTDDDDFIASYQSSSSSALEISSPEVVDCDENTRLYRQRNIYKTTRQCPKCGQEVEEDWMNLHLDDCLAK